MSKYQNLNPYHFVEFADSASTYARHVDDLLMQLQLWIGAGDEIRVFEVGCGEGLILNQIALRLGWKCEGTDVDREAVNMARQLNPQALIHCSTMPLDVGVDVALFADSLEHVHDVPAMLEWAKKAPWIVIAVPSQHDRHATRMIGEKDLDPYLSVWGDIVHRATRHARHLTIWKRRA